MQELMYNYYQDQLLKVCPYPVVVDAEDDALNNGPLKIKVSSDVAESKWLNLSPQAFLQIERVLIGLGVQDE